MNHKQNPYQALADQANRGDASARIQLRKKLEPQVVRIVRMTLARRVERTPLEKQIIAAARGLGFDSVQRSTHDREQLILNVASSVCNQMMTHVRSAAAFVSSGAETVCDS